MGYDGLLIDLIIVLVLTVATAAGLSRGTLRECLSLAVWLLVILLVIPWASSWSVALDRWIPDTALRAWSVGLGVVLATVAALAGLDLLVQSFHRYAGHASLDPLLGLIFGAARGLLFLIVGVVLAHRTGIPDRLAWHESQFVGYAENLAYSLRNHLPAGVAEQIQLRGAGDSERQFILPQDSRGHFIGRAWINGMPVEILVDTGATMVMIPAHLRYDLWLEAGESFPVSTATGQAIAQHTVIDAIKVGPILLHDVDAALVPTPKNTVLLGMSFLRQIRFHQTSNGLVLAEGRPGLE